MIHLTALCILLSGCTTWQPVRTDPVQYIRIEDPYQIRLRDVSGEWVQILRPQVQGDTITGVMNVWRAIDRRTARMPYKRAIPNDLQIQVKRMSKTQTAVSLGAIASVVAGVVVCATGGCR